MSEATEVHHPGSVRHCPTTAESIEPNRAQISVCNAAFLSSVFADLHSDEYLWTTSFSVSPSDTTGKEWAGRRTIASDCRDFSHGNAYFSVSTLKPNGGAVARKKDNFSRLFCIVLDDAGDCDLIPSWRLRTSANKVQIGFRLSTPLDDLNVATRLHESLSKGGRIPADKSGNNPIRYVRLPKAVNSKHSPPFQCQLEFFKPSATYDLSELIHVLGLDYEYVMHGDREKFDRIQSHEASHKRECDAELIRRIVSGENYHDPLLKLTARYSQRGMSEQATIEVVQGVMQLSDEAGSERWKNRFDDIPRTVKGAMRFAPAAVPKPEFKLMTAADIAALPPIRWLIKRVLPATGLAAVFGPSASGKSFLTLDMLAAVADGRDWFGHRCSTAPVVYVCLEGEAGLSQRLQAYKKHHGGVAADSLRFVTAPFRLLDQNDVAELSRIILEAGGANAVVCLDTLNQATPGSDENSSEDMGRAIAASKKLQSELGGLVVLVHHSGKDAARGMRGHSSLFAALDAVIEVARTAELRTWKTLKSKDGQDGAEHSFRLQVVELGLDEDLDSISSCIVLPGGDTDIKTKRLSPNQQLALRALTSACNEHGKPYPDADLGGIAAHIGDWRTEFYRISTADNTDAKKKAFQRARSDLQEKGLVYVLDDFYRPSDVGVQACTSLLRQRDTGQDGTSAGHVPTQSVG